MSSVVESTHTPLPHTTISARIERELLVALAFVLPLFEAPKNILWVALIAAWLVNRWRAQAFGGRWDHWDTLIAAWIASGFVVAAFAGIRDDEWRAATDIVRYGSVLWILKRSRHPDSTWFALIAAVILGTIAALVWSYYEWFHATTYRALNLNSVGHVNQSSNYLAIVFGVALMCARSRWRDSSMPWRAAYCALLAFFVVSLFRMESRATVGATFVMAFALLCAYAVRRRESLGPVVVAAALAASAVLVLSPQVVRKNTMFMEKSDWLNGRAEIWRVGLAAWREFPAFGVGMGNFSRIELQHLESWSAKRGETLDKRVYATGPHGHSLFVNTLAERGLVGLAAEIAILAAWAAALIRGAPGAGAPPLGFAYWGAAGSAWIITVAAGTLNTTLHHEQGLLCAILLGGWLSISRSPAAGTPPR